MKYLITDSRYKGEIVGVFFLRGKSYRVYQIQNETDESRFEFGIECPSVGEALQIIENTFIKNNYKKL
jgi:hypothetical protein